MTSQFAIRFAAHQIRNDGIIIYPTETVYGLGCDPNSYDAIERLTTLKQRDAHSGFLLLASDISQLDDYIETPTPKEIERISTAKVATSWVTKAGKNTPSWLISPDGTIGFRITKHLVAKKLCEHLDHPLISTSANIKGGTPVSNTLQCHQLFAGDVDYCLTSSIDRTEKPSVIHNLSTGQQLR